MPSDTVAVAAPRSLWKAPFLGPHGLRFGWRALGFFALVTLIEMLLGWLFTRMGLVPAPGTPWGSRAALMQEATAFVIMLFATVVFSRLERRPLATYGFPWRRIPWKDAGAGVVWGALAVALLFGLVVAAGGARVRGLALHGGALLDPLGPWLVAMVLVGLSEELFFRGYLQWALARGMRFWPAAILISVGFGALHFFQKPHENLVDFSSVTLIGLFFAFTVRRTGSLWFAIGFHFAFDWLALIGLAAPNTINDGLPLPGHLLDVAYTGPAWMTGGLLGLEASAFVFVVIAALYFFFARAYPRALWPAEERA